MKTESEFKDILTSNKVIAIIGFSDNRTRASNRIGRYLKDNGFKVYGINPRLKNSVIDEIECFASINELPVKAEIINVFRRSEFIPELIKEILALNYKPNVIWTQIGVISPGASEVSVSNDINYIENKCIMVEHNNL